MPDTKTGWERLGGEAPLRAIVDDFVARMFADPMIGFFFRDATQKRIAELEYQHAAEWLGGPIQYRGRPLDQAHAKHKIQGGQFDRRREILRQTLVRHSVPEDLITAWLDHVESQRHLITGRDCL